MRQEPSKARFEQASKEELIEVLKPFEEEVRSKEVRLALRNWADGVIGRSTFIDGTAARVARNACDLLDRLDLPGEE
jgi:hypothetical protein